MVDRRHHRRVLRFLVGLCRERKAATAIEYGLILALVVLALMAGVSGLGGETTLAWNGIYEKVKAVTPS